MTRVWYCESCGYEVHSRGRCHACRAKLTPSALPELESQPEDDEVGYRIDGWADRERGRLIVRLNDLGIEHRFEGDELVVDASDEERVDDLVAVLAEAGGAAGRSGRAGHGSGDLDAGDAAEGDPDAVDADAGDVDAAELDERALQYLDERALDDLDGSDADDDFAASVRLLADAATRLRIDPTDMQADADVAEASAGVFIADSYGPFDEEAWSAIGRVTRRLLAALGSEEALEDQIRQEAGVLEKLLAPLGATPTAVSAGSESEGAAGERTVYELSDWRPDQRAQLGFMLEEAGIDYDWEGDELLVPSAREEEVEELFDRIAGTGEDDDGDDSDERHYQSVAELFAASGRLAGDPTDESRQDAVLRWIDESEGPPLLGMVEVDWFRIRSRARLLATAIEGGHDPNEIHEHASQLHDMLRSVV